jgi:ATP-dependent RNA helicase DeaD
MNKFKKYGFNENLINNLNNQGINTPTAVQEQTIPKIMKNKDVMAEAQTGTGKTLAFLLPMFQKFDTDSKNIQGLILTPTRELALQITEEAKKLAINTDVKILSVYGGQDINSQLHKLKNNITLVIATPGRLLDHLNRRTINIDNLSTLVLDEADQMLHIGFKEDIETILKKTNKNKQTLCFSATINSRVKKIAYKFMNSPSEVAVHNKSVTLDAIKQKVIRCSDRHKQEALFNDFDKTNPFMAIIFCRTKRRADVLEAQMSENKYLCNKLHGDMTQNARQKVMNAFRECKYQYLIATDVASRGLDISGVTHIYNYDVPESPDTYIHRIGRTGRMGETGIAVTLLTPKDILLMNSIEKEIRMKVPKEDYKNGYVSDDGKTTESGHNTDFDTRKSSREKKAEKERKSGNDKKQGHSKNSKNSSGKSYGKDSRIGKNKRDNNDSKNEKDSRDDKNKRGSNSTSKSQGSKFEKTKGTRGKQTINKSRKKNSRGR